MWRKAHRIRAASIGFTIFATTTVTASAYDLRIGVYAAATSIDPLLFVAIPNQIVATHMFDRLVVRDAKSKLVSSLATEWHLASDTVWEFKLRPGVTWHDGVPFTADDVVFTFARAPNVPNSPASFGTFLAGIQRVEVVDPLTLRVIMDKPAPLLPVNLASLSIISRHAGEGATTADYNSGKATIGTGPYKFVHYTPEQIDLQRYDAWWGPKSDWEHVAIKVLSNAPSRLAALLCNDVDLIESVPPTDRDQLKVNPRISVVEGPSLMLMNLSPSYRADAPFITNNAGNKLTPNPLRDPRVRRALSLAIDRRAMTDRLMHGAGTPAGQWLPAGTFGHAPNLNAPPYDPQQAKQLLSDAGFPQGFRLTITTPNDRYQGDVAMTQAVAQMWARIGIQAEVEAMPFSVYSGRGSHGEFAVLLRGWNSPTAEAGNALFVALGTYDPARGRGVHNWPRYTNPELDKLTSEALTTLDDTAREALMVRATEMAMNDTAFIPLFWPTYMWAMRKDITYEPRMDGYTLAMDARRAE